MPFIWDDAAVAKLRELHEQGLSARQIATEIGAVSRNAVIGKIARSGLRFNLKGMISSIRSPTPPPDLRAKPKTPRRRINVGHLGSGERFAPYLPPEPSKPKEMKNCTLLQLTKHTCRWPIGDPRDPDFCFCGNIIAADGAPYCGFHMSISNPPRADRTANKESDDGKPTENRS